MTTDLTLSEKYLLLCYHPEKGRLLHTATYANYGLAGAILLEMAERGICKIKNNRLVLIDNKLSGDKALDLVIARIAKANRPKKLSSWISTITQSVLCLKIKQAVRDSLMQKRILSKREKTALLIFKYNRYPARNTKPRRQIIQDIQNLVIKRQIGNNQTMLLIALIGASKMTKSFFLPEDRKVANKRIKEITKNNAFTKMIDSTVTAVQAAVLAAITAATLVTATSTSSN